MSRWRQPVYLRHLLLRNVRAFEQLELSFGPDVGRPRRHTVVIGRNGTCKSTLLRSIALGLASKADAPAMLAAPVGGMVGPAGEEATIAVRAQRVGGADITARLTIVRKGGEERVRRHEAIAARQLPSLLCAYGSGRSTFSSSRPPGRPSYRTLDSVASLFDYSQGLQPPELVLRQLRDHFPDLYGSVVASLLRTLGLDESHQLELTRYGVTLTGPSIGPPVPFDGWADGYRMTLGWILDLYGWAVRADAIDESGGVRGVVLVDEVEQHLHPSMQSSLLPHLAAALPDVQMVATTHSPLVTLGTESRALVSLQRNESGRVVAVEPPETRAFSAEDVLVHEELFDTEPYGPDTQADRARHEELAALPREERSAADEEELRRIAQDLQIVRTVKLLRLIRDAGGTPFEQKLRDFLDEELCSDHAAYALVARSVRDDPVAYGV